MSEVEKKSAARPKSERRNPPVEGFDPNLPDADAYVRGKIDRSTDIAIEVVANHGIDLPADARVFNPTALEEIRTGKFDRRNARHRPQLVGGKDRVLEFGAGICFLAALMARAHPGLVVLAHEERAALADLGREIAAAHDLGSDRVKITDGPLIFATDGTDEASGLHALMKDFGASVLVLNNPRITPGMFAALPLQTVRRVIVSDRVADLGPYAAALSGQGFAPAPVSDRVGGLVLDRETGRKAG